jgi:hypothetical protein
MEGYLFLIIDKGILAVKESLPPSSGGKREKNKPAGPLPFDTNMIL